MKDQLQTIRAGLAIAIDAEGFVDKPVRRALLDAVKAAAQLEAMVGEPVGEVQHLHELNDAWLAALPVGTKLYAAPVAQQYEAGDVASASAQGFRDGVASVTQQEPQHCDDCGDTVPKRKCYCRAGCVHEAAPPAQQPLAWAKDTGKKLRITTMDMRDDADWRPLVYISAPVAQQPLSITPAELAKRIERGEKWEVAQQPQAEPDIHEAQGQIEFLDKKNNALSAAIRKVMARLADLLDEDQFKEIEEIVSFAGVQPQAEEVPLTHVLVPVDEPTDEMVDAACAAVDGLCRVDFVRAYVAAFAHLKAGYRDESYWCGWNAAIKFQQAEAVPVVDRVYEAAKRLVDHADFQLGGVLSAKSKARDIPSNAASKVKARHLASLRDALAKTPQQAEAVPSDVTDAMVDAYLKANDAYWRETDTQPKSPTKWRNGNPKEATRVSLAAAIAQQKGQP